MRSYSNVFESLWIMKKGLLTIQMNIWTSNRVIQMHLYEFKAFKLDPKIIVENWNLHKNFIYLHTKIPFIFKV
jgi:hypothetical protein